MAYFISLLLLVDAIGRHPQPQDVITQMIERKLEMRDCYSLRFRIESRNPGAVQGEIRKEAFTAAIWRAGDKLRVDIFDRTSDPPKDEMNTIGRHIICKNCERPNYTVVTTVYPSSLSANVVVAFRRPDMAENAYFVPDLDWRFLGLCNSPLSGYDKISIAHSYKERLANPLLRTAEHERDGEKCLVSELKFEKWQDDIWFGPNVMDNPVWFKGNGEISGSRGTVLLTTEVRWKSISAKHFYPERITHTSIHDGINYYEEVINVLHADFDTPVDPAVFTLAGLGLSDNQAIGYPELAPGDWPVWKDGRPDPSLSDLAKAKAAQDRLPSAVEPLPVAPYPASSNTSLVVAIVSALVAVVAVVLALISRRRRN